MPANDSCRECGSTEFIEADNIYAGDGSNLGIEVSANPKAILLTGTRHSKVKVVVCGHCGFIKLFAENPQELVAAYRKARNS
jgi:predicted nucleic-acid-binding Zn-ribbon protein